MLPLEVPWFAKGISSTCQGAFLRVHWPAPVQIRPEGKILLEHAVQYEYLHAIRAHKMGGGN